MFAFALSKCHESGVEGLNDKGLVTRNSSGSGGPINGTYCVLTATNLALPIIDWARLLTNQFDGSGNFIFTNPIEPTKPESFYLLQQS